MTWHRDMLPLVHRYEDRGHWEFKHTHVLTKADWLTVVALYVWNGWDHALVCPVAINRSCCQVGVLSFLRQEVGLTSYSCRWFELVEKFMPGHILKISSTPDGLCLQTQFWNHLMTEPFHSTSFHPDISFPSLSTYWLLKLLFIGIFSTLR